MVSRARKAFRLQLLPLVAGFVVLAAIVGTRSLLIESQQADNIAVRDAFELERRIVQTLSLVQDAETGQRGYMLTGEAPYLAPYQSAVERCRTSSTSSRSPWRTIRSGPGIRRIEIGDRRQAKSSPKPSPSTRPATAPARWPWCATIAARSTWTAYAR